MYFNYNGYIRDYIYKIYIEILNSSETNIEVEHRFKNLILIIKDLKYDLFKSIINVLYTDKYMLLKNKNKLYDEEKYILDQYNNMDINELLYVIEDDESIIDMYLFSSIDFKLLKKTNQALYMLEDYEYTKFLPSSYIEKLSIFEPITLEQLDNEFISNNLSIEEYIDEILIRSYGNIDNFKELLMEILYYFNDIKVLDLKTNFFLNEEINQILKNKTTNEIVDIFIFDTELLTYLVQEYLYNTKHNVKELNKEVLF